MLTYDGVCRFFAGEVFALDVLAKYDYLLRLDSDSYLIGKLTLTDGMDPFELLRARSASYAFLQVC